VAEASGHIDLVLDHRDRAAGLDIGVHSRTPSDTPQAARGNSSLFSNFLRRFVKGTANSDDDWEAGHLNTSPLNIGLLIIGGQMPSAKPLNCPSRGMDNTKNFGLGDDREEILYGDWSLARLWPEPDGQPGLDRINYRRRGMHYLYRCAPIFLFRKNGAPGYWQARQPILYTKPRVTSEVGCPPFASCGRALVADRFDRTLKQMASDPHSVKSCM